MHPPKWVDLNVQSLLDAATDATLVVNRAGEIVVANVQAEKLFGYSREELIGWSVESLIPPRLRVEHPQHRGNFFGDSRVRPMGVGLELFVLRGDGAEVPVDISLSPLTNEAGTFVVSAIRDATDRRRTEEQKMSEAVLRETRESEQRFRLIADTAPVLIWMSGTDKLCTYFNKPWLDFTGRSLDSELGNGWLEGVHPDYLRRCMDTYTQAFDRREKFSVEYRLRRYDGEYRWILDTGVPRFNHDGSFAGYAGSCIDVTDRKLAARELGLANERLHLAMQAGRAGGWEWDIESGRKSWFGEAHALLGTTREARSGSVQEFWDRVHPEDRVRLHDAMENAKLNNTEFNEEFRVVWPDGTVHWLRSQGRYLYAANAEPERMLGVSIDITQRKLGEEALRDSEARLRLAAQAGRMYVYEWDVATDVTVRSEEYANVLGLTGVARCDTRQQFLSRVHPDDRAKFIAAVADLTPENPTTQISYRMLRPDGAVIWLEKSGRAFFDVQGKMLRMIGIVADITERKLGEEALSGVSRRLIEAQEQERTRIARELHDDFGQRLALLTIELEQLQQNSPDLPAEVRSRMGELRKQTSEIATDIQSLSHELHSSKLEYLGIVAAMRGFCQEFGKQQKVEVDFKTHDLLSPVPPDISLCFFRVLQEALHNSAKHSGVRHFEVRLWGTSGEIHLTVGDSGAGFDREAAKERRGLGLISMEERLKLLKGTFSIESQPKRGTMIHARVPMSSGSDSMRAAG
jgi:PAS domain S-box-containing protein